MITPGLSGRRAALLAAVATLTLGSVATAPAGAAARAGSQSRHDDDGYRQINLVSDVPGLARILDPNLVNAWGLSAGPTSPLWVSDNGTSKSTLYRGATKPGEPAGIVPLVVSIPGGGSPTGQVFNSTNDFLLPAGGKAFFIFAGENGDLSAWNPAQGTTAVLVAPSRGGVYKGLALVAGTAANRLLAANFAADRIDVFDGAFKPVTTHGFRSVGIPQGYAPFNVAVLGGRVYVSYAKQDATKHDDVPGAGHGFVNVFTTGGRFLQRFASRGTLNSPWGLAIAPKGFGDFSGDLLIGNFGDGRIYAYEHPGKPEGTLRHADGHPVSIDGLWALLPGNGTAGATSDVWFSAGPDGESHGLLGLLRSLDD